MAEQKRKSGLGRGLASLIPTGPAQPRLGDSAANIVIGEGEGGQRQRSTTGEGDSGQQRTSTSNTQRRNSATSTRQDGKPDGTSSSVQNKANKSPQSQSAPEEAHVSRETNDFGASYQELPIGEITVNKKNPRHEFGQEELQELAHSIQECGLLQPIVVRPVKGTKRSTKKASSATSVLEAPYELIMGERRLRASKMAGLETIPAIVRETDDNAMLRDALLENIHRVQLNPLEEAAAYQQLLEEFNVTQAELAERLGRSRPVITNMIRLLQLPAEVQRRVAAGVLSSGHARALLGVKTGKEAQEEIAKRIVAEGLSVRATEELVTLMNRGEKPKGTSRKVRETPEKMAHWAHQFEDLLDTKVQVQMGAKKGRIVVEFADTEDFERIAEMMRRVGDSDNQD